MKFRDVSRMSRINDAEHSRTLLDSIMLPEVILALRDWIRADQAGVLIGAAALSFHVRPRSTQDIDLLFLDAAAIPDTVSGFNRISPALFRHDRTGVVVNVVTPVAIRVPSEIAATVARTALTSDGVRVASESGLVALKLFRLSFQDKADIVALVKTGRVDLSNVPLTVEKMSAFRELEELATTDPHPP